MISGSSTSEPSTGPSTPESAGPMRARCQRPPHRLEARPTGRHARFAGRRPCAYQPWSVEGSFYELRAGEVLRTPRGPHEMRKTQPPVVASSSSLPSLPPPGAHGLLSQGAEKARDDPPREAVDGRGELAERGGRRQVPEAHRRHGGDAEVEGVHHAPALYRAVEDRPAEEHEGDEEGRGAEPGVLPPRPDHAASQAAQGEQELDHGASGRLVLRGHTHGTRPPIGADRALSTRPRRRAVPGTSPRKGRLGDPVHGFPGLPTR